MLDFAGDALKKLPPDAKLHADTGASAGKILNVVVEPNPPIQGWRISFELEPGSAKLVEHALHPDERPGAALRDLDLSLDAMTPRRSARCRRRSPLAMPVQSLAAAPSRAPRPPSAPRGIALRRLLVIGGAVALTSAGGEQMYFVLNGGGPERSRHRRAAAVRGAVRLDRARLHERARRLRSAASPRGGLAPRHHPRRPAAGARHANRAADADLQRGPGARDGGLAGDPRIARRHRDGSRISTSSSSATRPTRMSGSPRRPPSSRCATAPAGMARIFYRRRAKNTERKAGNIAEWVRRFGGAYPQMLTLDADSVMDRRRDRAPRRGDGAAHPGVGLIQTLPVIVNGTTLFARMQQFAGRVYGPLIAHGIAWWHGAEGNYWGHNAMIRTRAFAEQAGLPHLRGRKPVRRPHPEPRFRRGGADAARRLGDPHGPRARRQLRGKPALAHRSRRARPALVPGQSAACRRAARARAALGQPAASADGHRLLCHRAAVAALPARPAC